MREKGANVQTAAAGQLNEPGQHLFAVYGQYDQSPVLTWLPILLGLFASAIVALAFCPVPRSQTVSPGRALFLAVAYVVVTVGIGVCVLATSGIVLGRRRPEISVWQVLPLFCSVAAWIAPVVAFYRRDSLWAVSAASVLSVFGYRLIYRYYLAIGAGEMFPASAESPITELSHATRLRSLTFAVLLLHFGALSIVASMAHLATILIGSAIVVLSFFRESASALNQSQLQSRFSRAVGFSITLGLAIILVGASLTPYLAVRSDDASSADTGATAQHSMAKPAGRSAKPKASFLQSASFFFQSLLADNPQPSAQDRAAGGTPTHGPYPALQALFGEGETASGSESSPLQKKSNKSKLTVLVADESVRGVILRPKIEDHVTIAPPLPTRPVFDGKPNERRVDPASIPFYGADWLFRASDKTLPADAVESRGDPASTSFQTTDFTPISMEARQNFGSLVELSCCRAIELVISNGDRRPGTVGVELILTNTRLPGKPHQSLGICPVNSTLRWFPGDNRPPVTEVLSFRLPTQAAIQRFDEATIRFEMRFPRERWSAKIAIEKFRLIPRGL
jgi:hypothetical protein